MALSAQEWADVIRRAGSAYGVNPNLLSAVNRREQSGSSGFVVNDWDSNAKKGTPSGGPFQFIRPTFDAFARQARQANPRAWRGVSMDWRNPEAQALAASWAFKSGKGSHWSTYQKALADVKDGRTGTASAPAAESSAMSLGGAANGRFNEGQQLALRMVFKDKPLLGKLISMSGASNAGSRPASTPSPAPAPSGGGGGGGGRPGSYKDLIALGQRFGLNIQGAFQTTGGKHSPNSYHYQGRAVDFGNATNSHANMMRFANYVRANPGQFTEFFWEPAGFSVKNGKLIQGNLVGGHADHIHVARSAGSKGKR